MSSADSRVQALSQSECDDIVGAAFHVLESVGLCIENRRMLEHMAEHGAHIDLCQQRVRFPEPLVDRFLSEMQGRSEETQAPRVTASAGIYSGFYHDPETRDFVPWTEERLATYIALARALPHIGSAGILGCRLDVPHQLEPLYERFYCWKYGAGEHGSIHLDELCPQIYDLYQLRADQLGVPMQRIFRGTAYLIPALKLGRHEAYQYLYFWERGLQVSLGDMHTMGATSPVTLAGSLAIILAEQLAIGMVQHAFFQDSRFGISCSLSPLDMRTLIRPYGRPEMAVANMAMTQIARRLGLPFRGHAGLTDAKVPSCESGAQKALTAIPTLLSSGHVHIDAGLLSIDEVCSPLQLILDNEFCGAMAHICRGLSVDEETLALELIEALGPGGHYIATDHTARHFRQELWEPSIWSRQMLGAWAEEGSRTDADRAAEVYRTLLPSLDRASQLTEEQEEQLLAFIEGGSG